MAFYLPASPKKILLSCVVSLYRGYMVKGAGTQQKNDNGWLKVWFDGKVVKYATARVPILTHSLQYGSGIFEGMRAYEAERGIAIFRLEDHVKRFFNTAKIYSMELGYTPDRISKAVIDIVRANGLHSCYIRPYAFYNTDQIGVSAYGKDISVFVAAIPFGAYFGEGRDRGIRCKISSWRRINSEILPVEAKASGNYINSIIANTEARKAGYDEAILLSTNGMVAEGPGENIFIVKDNNLITPDDSADILIGITRDSIIKIAEEVGLEVAKRRLNNYDLTSFQKKVLLATLTISPSNSSHLE